LKLTLKFDRRVVEGYHGTSWKRALQAVQFQGLSPSRNSWDWLGDGIYFWEGSLNRGIEWAVEHHGEAPAVIKADVRFGRCLDLFDTAWVPVFQAAYQRVVRAYQQKALPLPRNRGGNHSLDRVVINYICEELYQIDTVRGPFLEGKEVFPGSFLPDLAHVQITVRNPDMIVGRLEAVYPAGRNSRDKSKS
jgi:hypothetical protein